MMTSRSSVRSDLLGAGQNGESRESTPGSQARSDWRLQGRLQERICACRRQTGRGPRLVAAATVWGAQTHPPLRSARFAERTQLAHPTRPAETS
jgi:hypothetical protein